MSTILFAPFSASSAESGLIYLLGNYIRYLRHDVFQLRCNGAFSLCERDAEYGWRRTVRSCAVCTAEQRNAARWGQIESKELSTFLQPDEIQETWRTLQSVPTSDLIEFKYRGVPLFDLARGSFRDYFGVETPDLGRLEHEVELRKLLLATWRMSIAVRRFNNRMTPTRALVAGGQDYLTRTFVAHSVGKGIGVVVFQWCASDRAINVINLRDNSTYGCEFVVDDLKNMRNNPESWSEEPVEQLHGILDFIGMGVEPHLKKAAQ